MAARKLFSFNFPLNPHVLTHNLGCRTPIGLAIGIATHHSYSPDSATGLLVVGIMNALSFGLLVFTSLVELVAPDFVNDESWMVLKGPRRVKAFSLVFLGAFAMSMVAAWA